MAGVLPGSPEADPNGSGVTSDTKSYDPNDPSTWATEMTGGDTGQQWEATQSTQTAPTQIATAGQEAAAGDMPAQGGGGYVPPPAPKPSPKPSPSPSPGRKASVRKWLWGGVAVAAATALTALAWPKKR